MKNNIYLPAAVRGYLHHHRLDEVVVGALNDAAKVMPDDPFGYVAERFAEHCASAPGFFRLQFTPGKVGELSFHIIARIRGIHARVGVVRFDEMLFQMKAPASVVAEGGEEEAPPSEEERTAAVATAVAGQDKAERHRRQMKIINFLEQFFKTNFCNVLVEDVLGLHERCASIGAAPVPIIGAEVNLQRAAAGVTQALIDAGSRALNVPVLELLQRALVNAGLSDFVSLPLRTQEDLATWRSQGLWPRVAYPIFHAGSPSVLRPASMRFCAAFSPFIWEPATATPGTLVGCPPLGWVPKAMQLGRKAASEAAAALAKEKDKNIQALAVGGVAYGHPEGVLTTARLARQAAEAAAAAEAGGGRTGPDLAAEISGVLLAYAEDAWLAEEDVYEVEVGKKLTLEQLVNLYAELAEEGWVRMIVEPFRGEDVSAGCELLHARAPGLRLVLDAADLALTPEGVKGEAFSSAWRLAGSVSASLAELCELAPPWEEADGFGRCVILDAEVVRLLPAVLEAVLACRGVEVLLLPPEATGDDLARLSARMDEFLCTLLYPGSRDQEEA